MTPDVLVLALVIAPVLALTVLRVNATLVFLSLCLGQVLVQFVGGEAASTVGIIASDGRTNPQLVALGLLLVPAVFTSLVMARTVKGHLKLALNILPAISVGVLGLLLAEPLFTPGLRGTIEATDAWYVLTKLQTLIIGASAIVSLFFLWLQRPKHHHDDKHHK